MRLAALVLVLCFIPHTERPQQVAFAHSRHRIALVRDTKAPVEAPEHHVYFSDEWTRDFYSDDPLRRAIAEEEFRLFALRWEVAMLVAEVEVDPAN